MFFLDTDILTFLLIQNLMMETKKAVFFKNPYCFFCLSKAFNKLF